MAKRRRGSTDEKKALRRVEEARAAYTKVEGRVAVLRKRLARAEEKLTRRGARLSAADAALVALAAIPATGASEDAPLTQDKAASERVAVAAGQDEPALPELAGVSAAAPSGANGATAPRPRSRPRAKKPAEDG